MEPLDRFPQYNDRAEDKTAPADVLSPEQRFLRMLFGPTRSEVVAAAMAAESQKN